MWLNITTSCQYTKLWVYRLWKISCHLHPRKCINISVLSFPHWSFYCFLSIERVQRHSWAMAPSSSVMCDVTWAVWSLWEKTLMHTGNNQGNTGRVQRNANIFRVLKKQYHTHIHIAKYGPPPPHSPCSHTHATSYTLLTTIHTHTYITHWGGKKQKKKQPAPWQNSPQVHLHKTLSLTKWLHLTSWVGGRTSPVAAGYLQILQSFSRQATVSWPPL